jgi:hypothetical protein
VVPPHGVELVAGEIARSTRETRKESRPARSGGVSHPGIQLAGSALMRRDHEPTSEPETSKHDGEFDPDVAPDADDIDEEDTDELEIGVAHRPKRAPDREEEDEAEVAEADITDRLDIDDR